MSFADEVRMEERSNATPCKTCTYIDSLLPEDRSEVVAVLADPTVSACAISRALTKRGYPVGDKAIRRHRESCGVQ